MAVVNKSVSSSLLKFTFRDDEGGVVAFFRMNPADIKLVQRCQEVSAYFEERRDKIPDNATLEEAAQYNN